MSDLAFATATEQARLVRTKEVSPVELVELYLSRIDSLDGKLNAFVALDAEGALQQARAAEQLIASSGELPPFCGVPLAVKDLVETRGLRTTFGSKIFADNVPPDDAAVVAKLRAAGFIVFGKTNVPEFGTLPQTESELLGICRNPWNTDHTPGGSSGGAAAALAAGLCPIAHGSDGGGSIRIPASHCGLFGLKPSRGRISHAPGFGNLAGLGTSGPIARSVLDAAAMLDAMTGYVRGDPYWLDDPDVPFAQEATTEPGRLRIGFTTRNATDAEVDAEVAAGLADTARLLGSLGHDVVEASPETGDPNLVASFITVWQGLSANFPIPDIEQLEPVNRALAEGGNGTSMMDFLRAATALERTAAAELTFWDDHDVLLTPTSPLPPPPVGWIAEEADPWAQLLRAGTVVAYTAPVNVSGQPAATVPLHRTSAGLPVGMHLVGRPGDDATLIRLAAQLEAARPWADDRPPIS